MTDNDIAFFAGIVLTLMLEAVYIILVMTADFSPVERRARRLAILASVAVSAVIWTMTVAVYSLVSELVGSFLIFPSIALTAIGVWHASRITYRKMGGGNELSEAASVDARA